MVVAKAKTIDPTHLELSKPIGAPEGGTVLVSVAEPSELDDERLSRLALSAQELCRAYGESEPEYSAAMVKERNPEYAP